MDEQTRPDETNVTHNYPQPTAPPRAIQQPTEQALSVSDLPGAFDLLRPSISALKTNIWAVMLLVFIPISILTAVAVGSLAAGGEATAVSPASVNFTIISIGLLTMATFIILMPAYMHIQLKSAKGIKTTVGDATSVGVRYLPRYIGLSILVGVMLIIGFLLLIIPSFIVLRRYFLAAYYLVDQDLSIREAMSRSAESSRSYSWRIYDIMAVNMLFSLIGILPVIGQLVGGILQLLYSFAPAVRYHQIKEAYYGSTEELHNMSSQAPLPPSAQPPMPPTPGSSTA